MILLHQTFQIVDETVTGVLSVLKMSSHVNCLYRAHFLTHAAENATELVYLVDDWITVSLIVLAADKPDAVCRTNRRTEPTSNTLRSTICVL